MNIDKHNLFQDFLRASKDEQLWQDLLVALSLSAKVMADLRKRKINEKIKENVV